MNPGSESAHEKFLEINQAYSVLSNDAKRREYDAARSQDSLFSSRRPAAQTWAARQQTMRRENIRPDDWVQYRGKGYQGTAGTRRPFFDFDAHRKGHYGQDANGKAYDDSLGKRGDKRAFDEANRIYANMQAERRCVS